MPSPGGFEGLAGTAAFAASLGGVATALATSGFAEAVEGALSAFAMLEVPLITGLKRDLFFQPSPNKITINKS
jgi:hypothetical protein